MWRSMETVIAHRILGWRSIWREAQRFERHSFGILGS
jgi:hypothetical protein